MVAKKSSCAETVLGRTEEKIPWIDPRFVDVVGGLQCITIPSASLRIEDFQRGIGELDGSSINGFKELHESDMMVKPNPSTFAVLPWYTGEHCTGRTIVDIHEGGTYERFTWDSCFLAQKAMHYAKDSGYGTTYRGSEIEFFVFDGVRLAFAPDDVRNPRSWARSTPCSKSCTHGSHGEGSLFRNFMDLPSIARLSREDCDGR
jgi:glutamine synthetase